MPNTAPVFMQCERKAWETKGANDSKRIRGRKGVELRKRRMERTNWLCEDCLERGEPRAAQVVDHIKPIALGGEDIDENTRNLCHECHSTRTTEQFGRRVHT